MSVACLSPYSSSSFSFSGQDARGAAYQWDLFGENIQQVAANAPYHVGIGSHGNKLCKLCEGVCMLCVYAVCACVCMHVCVCVCVRVCELLTEWKLVQVQKDSTTFFVQKLAAVKMKSLEMSCLTPNGTDKPTRLKLLHSFDWTKSRSTQVSVFAKSSLPSSLSLPFDHIRICYFSFLSPFLIFRPLPLSLSLSSSLSLSLSLSLFVSLSLHVFWTPTKSTTTQGKSSEVVCLCVCAHACLYKNGHG